MKYIFTSILCLLSFSTLEVRAEFAQDPLELLKESQKHYQNGQYFTSARFAYSVLHLVRGTPQEGLAYAMSAIALSRAELRQSALYFFLKTLETKDSSLIRRVIPLLDGLTADVGPDALREYLMAYVKPEDFGSLDPSTYFFGKGKTEFLQGNYVAALESFSRIRANSPYVVEGILYKGTINLLTGKRQAAEDAFKQCVEQATQQDLKARCNVGLGRLYYEIDRFRDAEIAFDRVPKSSLVWPELLLDQAHNAFAKREYNRSLGKLVSYQSSALRFVADPEIELLQAQSYLALCLYPDASERIKALFDRYNATARAVKIFAETNVADLEAFYVAGKRAYSSTSESKEPVSILLRRMVKTPYFEQIFSLDDRISKEKKAIDSLAKMAQIPPQGGFVQFLNEALRIRTYTSHKFGGESVKRRLVEEHTHWISQLEKASYIQLEVLAREKTALMKGTSKLVADRSRGNVVPERMPYQMFWKFNSEFWNDELGDYIFGLKSQCVGKPGDNSG